MPVDRIRVEHFLRNERLRCGHERAVGRDLLLRQLMFPRQHAEDDLYAQFRADLRDDRSYAVAVAPAETGLTFCPRRHSFLLGGKI
jgi:hypothetical protein